MTLETARKNIDAKDKELLKIIAKRQSYLKTIVDYKKKHNLPIHQPQREKEILASKVALAKKLNLDKKMVEKIFLLIMRNSRKIQSSI